MGRLKISASSHLISAQLSSMDVGKYNLGTVNIPSYCKLLPLIFSILRIHYSTRQKSDIVRILKLQGGNIMLTFNTYTTVDTLTEGAIQYGGATQVNGVTFSYIDTGADIEFYPANLYGLMIPSTIDIDQKIDPRPYIDKYTSKLELIASNIVPQEARGSWYSEELQKVIIENSTILTFTSDYDPTSIMKYLELLANRVKEDMKQEAVSIMVNHGLVIV